MENATKALIIAGAVLIGIILLSIGVALWRNFSNFSADNAQSTRTRQLEEFNVKFKKYEFNSQTKKEDEKNYITAQDVRTIVNLAKDYNDKNGNGEEIIEVFYKNTKAINGWNEEDWVKFLNNANSNKLKYAMTTRNSSSNSDIVNRIDINEIQ